LYYCLCTDACVLVVTAVAFAGVLLPGASPRTSRHNPLEPLPLASQTTLALAWREQTLGASSGPAPLHVSNTDPAPPTTPVGAGEATGTTTRKRTRTQMWAVGAAAVNRPVDAGRRQGPRTPSVWDPSTTNDMVCTYIAAHNSYVSAVAAQHTVEAIVAFTEGAATEAEGTPTSKRRRVFDCLGEAAAPEKLAADGGTSAGDSGGDGFPSDGKNTAGTARPCCAHAVPACNRSPAAHSRPEAHAHEGPVLRFAQTAHARRVVSLPHDGLRALKEGLHGGPQDRRQGRH